MLHSSYLIQQALNALRADGLLEVPKIVGLEPLDGGSTGASLFRFYYTLTDGSSPTFIIKKVGRLEYNLHRLLCREVPGTVPRFIGAWPTYQESTARSNGDLFLLMEDVTCDELPSVTRKATIGDDGLEIWTSVASAATFRGALRLLATVHTHFLNKTLELRRRGVQRTQIDPVTLSESARRTHAALDLYADLLELPIDVLAIREVLRLGALLTEQLTLLQTARTWTLVHGDFHLGNIAVGREGGVRLLDWGSATLQVLVWDLVLCGEPEVEYYLGVLEACRCHFKSETLFYSQLRAAVICRTYLFLEMALNILVNRGSTRVAAALPLCVERLIEAASSPAFRGGRGVRFVT